jgi:hypothetical protein
MNWLFVVMKNRPLIVDLPSGDTTLSRNRLVGHVPQKDLANNVMDQNATSGELRVSSAAKQRCGGTNPTSRQVAAQRTSLSISTQDFPEI